MLSQKPLSTNSRVRFLLEVAIASLIIASSGILVVSTYVYPRAEADKLEKRVESLEVKIDRRLERIEDKLDKLKD